MDEREKPDVGCDVGAVERMKGRQEVRLYIPANQTNKEKDCEPMITESPCFPNEL